MNFQNSVGHRLSFLTGEQKKLVCKVHVLKMAAYFMYHYSCASLFPPRSEKFSYTTLLQFSGTHVYTVHVPLDDKDIVEKN